VPSYQWRMTLRIRVSTLSPGCAAENPGQRVIRRRVVELENGSPLLQRPRGLARQQTTTLWCDAVSCSPALHYQTRSKSVEAPPQCCGAGVTRDANVRERYAPAPRVLRGGMVLTHTSLDHSSGVSCAICRGMPPLDSKCILAQSPTCGAEPPGVRAVAFGHCSRDTHLARPRRRNFSRQRPVAGVVCSHLPTTRLRRVAGRAGRCGSRQQHLLVGYSEARTREPYIAAWRCPMQLPPYAPARRPGGCLGVHARPHPCPGNTDNPRGADCPWDYQEKTRRVMVASRALSQRLVQRLGDGLLQRECLTGRERRCTCFLSQHRPCWGCRHTPVVRCLDGAPLG
jgi:hypothetical protein